MRIWYVNHYSGSIKSPKTGRPFYLSRSLVKIGVNTSVICSSFHHNLGQESVSLKEPYHYKDVEGIKFIWLKTSSYIGNGLSRLFNMISFSWRFWKINFVENKVLPIPDAIIISSVHPFHIFAGVKWAKKFNAKLIFEVRDIWPLSLEILLHKPKYHPLIILLSFLEKYAYKKSDLIISPLKNAHLHINKVAGLSKEFFYLPNGFSPTNSSRCSPRLENELSLIRNKHEFIIMHAGSMGTPNGLELLIEASNSLKENCKVGFVFIGDGDKKKQLVNSSFSKNVYFFDRIPRSEVQSTLEFCDIGYCGSQDVSGLYNYGVSPNKIFNYMYAKKPVLLGVYSPGNPIEESNSGVCFKPENKAALISSINYLYELEDNERLLMGERGYEYLHRNHNFDVLAQKLSQVIELRL